MLQEVRNCPLVYPNKAQAYIHGPHASPLPPFVSTPNPPVATSSHCLSPTPYLPLPSPSPTIFPHLPPFVPLTSLMNRLSTTINSFISSNTFLLSLLSSIGSSQPASKSPSLSLTSSSHLLHSFRSFIQHLGVPLGVIIIVSRGELRPDTVAAISFLGTFEREGGRGC